MSVTPPSGRQLTPSDIRDRKGGVPVVCLTAYTTPMARLVDAHCDLALVGGRVEIGPRPGGGTAVRLVVPPGGADA